MRAVILLFVLFACRAQAATITVVGDQAILSGRIDGTEFAQLRDVAAAHGAAITTVILRDLHPGGNFFEPARMAADEIRERGWRTAVSGTCSGVCAFLFLGGVSRHFTDDKAASATRVGFTGTYFVANAKRRNYDKGSFSPMAAHLRREWVKTATQGKISEEILDSFMPREWAEAHNTTYFFDSNRIRRADGASVFVCNSKDPADKNRDHCHKPATDAYKEGIVTSRELVRSNDAPERPAKQ